MRKKIKTTLLLTLSALFALYSCKKPVVNPPVITDATEVDFFECLYFGNNNLGEGYHIYRLRLVTKGLINSDGKVVKEGKSYSFALSSKAPNGDPSPNVAIYSIKDDFSVQGFNRNFAGVLSFDNAGNKTDEATFVEGNVVIEADKITFKGKDSKGNSHDIIYNGTFTTKQLDVWTNEPKTPENVSFTLSFGDFIDYGDFFQNNTKNLYVALLDNQAVDNATKQALFEFVLPKETDTIPYMTYTVASSKEEGTLLASTGMIRTLENYILVPSAVWNKSTNKIYYIASGAAVVRHRKIDFNGQSHFGSTVNVSYTGDMVFRQPTNTITKTMRKGTVIPCIDDENQLFFKKR